MSFLPYPSCRATDHGWIGDVPAHWDIVGAKRMFSIVGGSTPSSDQQAFWDGEIVWVTPADLSRVHSLSITTSQRMITPQGLGSCGTTVVPRGSIILSTRAPIGSLAIAGTELCTNQGCKSLVPLREVDTTYFAYVLLHSTEELNVRGKGTTFLELSGDALAAFPLPVPPLSEQLQISAFLNRETAKIDALVDEQQHLIDLLKEKRQAVITRAVTVGIDPDVPLKSSGIDWLGDVPAHWRVVPITHLVSYMSYGFTNPMPTDDDGPYMLTANDIDYGRVRYETARRTSRAAFNELLTGKSRPVRGDILVTKDGTLGRTAVHDGQEVCINQSVALLRPNPQEVTPEFLGLALLAGVFQERMIYEAGGTTIKHIYISRLAKMPLVVPPLGEQMNILARVGEQTRQLDDLMEETVRALALLQERRTSLIAAAVTGKIDVRSVVDILETDASSPKVEVEA